MGLLLNWLQYIIDGIQHATEDVDGEDLPRFSVNDVTSLFRSILLDLVSLHDV